MIAAAVVAVAVVAIVVSLDSNHRATVSYDEGSLASNLVGWKYREQ